jgi:hypothetical protein
MAARKRKIQLTESWKEKIRISMLLNRLNNHVFDDEPMSASQLDAAKFLLNKVIANPAIDQNVNHSGEFTLNLPWMNQVIQQRN